MTLPSKAERVTPVERLQDWFAYNPETGSLKWKVRKWTDFPRHTEWFTFCARRACKEAGNTQTGGYRQVQVQTKLFLAHRIIWALQTGEWPAFEIDHINHDRADNRWVNLRAAPGSVNDMNRSRHRDNTSGTTGVSYCKANRASKWRAMVELNRKIVFLKYFTTKDEAVLAVLAAREFHGFHPNHGRQKPCNTMPHTAAEGLSE